MDTDSRMKCKPQRPLHACRACRKRRTRCDQQQPCRRCKQLSIECFRDGIKLQTKPELRQEKADLEEREEASFAIFEHLAAGNPYDAILQSLRRHEPLDQIAKQLTNGREEANNEQNAEVRSPAAIQNLSGNGGESSSDNHCTVSSFGTAATDEQDWAASSPEIQRSRGGLTVSTTLSSQSTSSDVSPWSRGGSFSIPGDGSIGDGLANASPSMMTDATSVSSGDTQLPMQQKMKPAFSQDGFLETLPSSTCLTAPVPGEAVSKPAQLMTLPTPLVLDLTDAFFSWQAAPFPVIQRSLFLSDFLTGKTDSCSPALVRAISCLGCRALGGYDISQCTYASIGNRLFDDARALLVEGEGGFPIMPDAQAFGLLALHQLGIGQYADARQLADDGVRQMGCVMGGVGKVNQGEFNVTENTALCSAVALSRFVRLVTSYFDDTGPSSEATTHIAEGLAGQKIENIATTTCSSSLIFQLIDSVYRFYQEQQTLDLEARSFRLEKAYSECLLWYEATLEVTSKQNEHCPFAHIFYHFCLLLLFRPFCHLPIVSGISPATICAESSEAIKSLAGSSSSMESRASNIVAFVVVLVGFSRDIPGDMRGPRRLGRVEMPNIVRMEYSRLRTSQGTVI